MTLARPGFKFAAAFVAVSLLLAACAPTRSDGIVPPGLAAADAAFRDWMERHGAQEGSLAIGRDGRLVAALGYGGREADDRVLVASLSKAITAVCAGTLVDEGRLGFDTRLRDALAAHFARNGAAADPRLADVTIGQLLTHRAGFDRDTLPDPASGPLLQAHLRGHAPGDASIDPLLAAGLARTLPRAPGERFAYTNVAYLALGAAIEAADGRPYADACAARALAPLGLDAVTLDPDWAVLSSFAGWRLSAPEYLAFLRAFDDDSPVLGPQARAFLRDPQGKHVARGSYYALGTFARATADGGRNLWHSGRWHWRAGGVGDSTSPADLGAYFVRLSSGEAFVATFAPVASGADAVRDLDRTMIAALRAVKDWPEGDLFARYGIGPMTNRGSVVVPPRSAP